LIFCLCHECKAWYTGHNRATSRKVQYTEPQSRKARLWLV